MMYVQYTRKSICRSDILKMPPPCPPPWHFDKFKKIFYKPHFVFIFFCIIMQVFFSLYLSLNKLRIWPQHTIWIKFWVVNDVEVGVVELVIFFVHAHNLCASIIYRTRINISEQTFDSLIWVILILKFIFLVFESVFFKLIGFLSECLIHFKKL